MITEFITENEDDTIRLATDIAHKLEAPAVLTLSGALGAGKSVFARAIIRALTGNPAEEVPSPTFTLVQTYETAQDPLRHFDLYRLEKPEEVLELDWDDAMFDGLSLIEWPDKAGNFLPDDRIDISLEIIAEQKRRITITPQGETLLHAG